MYDIFSAPFSTTFLKLAPRIIIGGLAAYYSLGLAYNMGLMAVIDKFAIKILLPNVGYIGLGAVMPTVQWYTAWTARLIVGTVAAFLYDLCEKIATLVYRYFVPEVPQIVVPLPQEAV